MHHKMTNIKSNYIVPLKSIVNVCSSTLPAALYFLRCSKSLRGFRNLSLYDRQVFYNPSFLPPSNVQPCILLFLFSLRLFQLSGPLVWWTKPTHKCKRGFKNVFFNIQKRTGYGYSSIGWYVLHIVCGSVCKLFQTVVLDYNAFSGIEILPPCSSSKSQSLTFISAENWFQIGDKGRICHKVLTLTSLFSLITKEFIKAHSD